MQKVLHKTVLFINPLSEIAEFAIYKKGKLHHMWQKKGYISDILADELYVSVNKYKADAVIYINGPGSFMAIKLTYIAIRTLKIISGIPFFSCSAFSLNGNRPMKAMGNLYFIKEKETIITRKFNEKIEQVFKFPFMLEELKLKEDCPPEYIIPAV